MQNSNRFLIAYNSIENSMKKYASSDYHLPFTKLLQISKKHNAIIRKYYSELKDFAELRNAIVHDSFDSAYAIAEPHAKIVKKIEFIEQEITEPQKIIPLFRNKVTTFQADNSLKDILNAINFFSYSKFPIYDNKDYCGILTKEGIVNWLAANVDKISTISFSDITVKTILQHQKNKNNFKFVSRNSTLYDVNEIFNKNSEINNKKIEALLVTDHGEVSEPLLGIITLEDLIKVPKKKY